ncbi:hypothetical protein ACUOFC_42690, partial [Escherichia sp. TWPC-MK]
DRAAYNLLHAAEENGHIVEQGDASCFTEPQTEAFKNYLSH